MAFYEPLSGINSYLRHIYWEERISISDIRSDMECINLECINRVDASIKSSNTVTALHVSAKMLTRAMQKNKHSFPGNRDV